MLHCSTVVPCALTIHAYDCFMSHPVKLATMMQSQIGADLKVATETTTLRCRAISTGVGCPAAGTALTVALAAAEVASVSCAVGRSYHPS